MMRNRAQVRIHEVRRRLHEGRERVFEVGTQDRDDQGKCWNVDRDFSKISFKLNCHNIFM